MFRLSQSTNINKQHFHLKNAFYFFCKNNSIKANDSVENDAHLIFCTDKDLFKMMKSSMTIKENFLSESEEKSLFNEIEPFMKKKRYEFDHWDNVKNKK